MRQVQSVEREKAARGDWPGTGTATGQSRVNSDSQRTADMMSLKIVTILIAASVLLTEVNV